MHFPSGVGLWKMSLQNGLKSVMAVRVAVPGGPCQGVCHPQ